MNSLDKQYTELLATILEHGIDKEDRTGTGTRSIFGYTIRHNMQEGFPLLTTKRVFLSINPIARVVSEDMFEIAIGFSSINDQYQKSYNRYSDKEIKQLIKGNQPELYKWICDNRARYL